MFHPTVFRYLTMLETSLQVGITIKYNILTMREVMTTNYLVIVLLLTKLTISQEVNRITSTIKLLPAIPC